MGNKKINKQFCVDVDEVVNQWIEKWQTGSLLPEDIQETWRIWLPKVANAMRKTGKWCLEIDKMKEIAIAILEKFIFYGYPTDYANQMAKREESVTCCSVTSPFYSFYKCLDCEVTSANRVLCLECFLESAHRQHKYTVVLGSSWYCCCGENGTWEKPWYCTKHPIPPHQNEEDNDSTIDLESRVRIVMEAICLQTKGEGVEENVDGSGGKYYVVLHTNLYYKSEKIQELFKKVKRISSKKQHELFQIIYKVGKYTMQLPKRLCDVVKVNSMKPGSPFNVEVLHVNQVIDQEFTFKMFRYLQMFLKRGKKLRTIFAEVFTKPSSLSDQSMVEKMLLSIKSLPKVFRDICKELLIIGTMTQYNTKVCLVNRIIEKYDSIMQSVDVHNANYQMFIFAISMQLFKIPNLSHGLIANQNSLYIVLNSLLKENLVIFNAWKKMDKKSEFDESIRIRSQNHFYIILSLLDVVPKKWTEELRLGFLAGLSCFLKILFNFQYVDSETRESKEHVEHEQDNAAALSMLVNLGECACTILKWCSSDDKIFTVACVEAAKLFRQNVDGQYNASEKLVLLLNYRVSCMPYDAETQPVSICLPLSRFLVGLHLIGLEKCKDTVPTTFVPKMLHPILQIQVMSAQLTAGMWKQNGDRSLDRMEIYLEAHGRHEIYDRDIQLLQISAATIDSNEFLIHLLEKYGLIGWASESFEEDLRNLADDDVNAIIYISEQFLQLLITVLIERYVSEVGYVTDEERLRHEVIHRLCYGSHTRSQLEEYIQRLCVKPTCFEAVLKEVSVYKKPTFVVNEDALYEIRTEFFDSYNPLFYHYTPEEMSETKEDQRQRRKSLKEPDCFPPTALPKLKEFFIPMVAIFQCDITLHIIRTVLERSCELKSRSYSVTQLENVLYLIGYALQEQKSGNYSALSFTEKAAKWRISELLESVLTISRSDLPQDLLKWTIRKYNEVSGVSANITNEISLYEQSEQLRKSKLVAAKRAKVMQEISSLQKNFMKNNSMFDKKKTRSSPDDSEDSDPEHEKLLQSLEKTCILCQEVQTLDRNNKALVTPGYVQLSDVLCLRRETPPVINNFPMLTSNLDPDLYVSSCGHIMHASCFKIYLDQIWAREMAKSPTDKYSGFDFKKQEFLCPLCNCLSNTVLPLVPPAQISRKNPLKFKKDLTDEIRTFASNFQKNSSKSPLLVWRSLSYTIHVIENILRDSNKPLLGHLSSRHHACLESFINTSRVISRIYPITKSYLSFVYDLYYMLNEGTIESSTLLSSDIFNVWVVVTLSRDNISSTTRSLVFVAEIFKILIRTNFDNMVDDLNHNEEATPFKFVLKLLHKRGIATHLSENFLWNYVQKASRPFLRCCVILHSFLKDAPQPMQLMEVGGDTFSNMCLYLELPQIREELFDVKKVLPIVRIWFNHPCIERSKALLATDPLQINQFIKLPQDYCDVISMASRLKCARSKFSDPMICLICGAVLCCRTCCLEFKDGKATSARFLHDTNCYGMIYLRVGTSLIEFCPPFNNRGIKMPGPYLDDYFENTSQLIMCDKLSLSLDMYKHFHTLWLNHGILEEISRVQNKNFLHET